MHADGDGYDPKDGTVTLFHRVQLPVTVPLARNRPRIIRYK